MLHSKLSNFQRVIPINIPVSLGEVLIHSFHHYQLVYYHKIDTKSQSRPHDNLAEIIIFLWVFLWFSYTDFLWFSRPPGPSRLPLGTRPRATRAPPRQRPCPAWRRRGHGRRGRRGSGGRCTWEPGPEGLG